jgi:peptidylprolyl isomerase
VTGEVGSEPKVEWSSELSVTKVTSEVVIAGDGDEVAAGDNVLAQVWVGNGTSKAVAYSSFAEKPQVINVGESTIPALADAIEGATVGSRLLIAAPPKDAFGDQGNPQMGLGNKDTVVFIVDVVGELASGPQGGDRKPAQWAPEVVVSDELPTGLNFANAPEPVGKLLRTTLIAGEGDPVAKGDHLYVNYLGQVTSADAPFDESYSRGAPFDFVIGEGSVVAGWDEGLIGVNVGSRVILQIPPDKGYGEAGQPDVGIKGTDTMYFIVDVLAVA